jgi:hypothetical protein
MERTKNTACRHYSIKRNKLNNCGQKERQTAYICSFEQNTKCLHLRHLEVDVTEEHAASIFMVEGLGPK